MTIREYQEIIEKTVIYPKEIGLAYCAMGLTGEAGEIANKVKKLYRDDNIDPYQEDKSFKNWDACDSGGDLEFVLSEIKKNLKKEIGDVLWYCTALANELGLTLEEIMEANYNKLIKRRETNTIGGSGDNREEKIETDE